MSAQDQAHRQIAEVVQRFEEQLTATGPSEVLIDNTDDYLLVTLRQALCKAERLYVQEPEAHTRLEELYIDVYNAAKEQLENSIAAILGRRVLRSRVSIDPLRGDVMLIFVFREELS